MTHILRIYDLAECGSHGVPLDFEKCRNCDGIGSVDRWGPTSSRIPERLRCPTCDGYGSLKAAALAGRYRFLKDQLKARDITLGGSIPGGGLWPYDLRPEELNVLCLRCYVEAKNEYG